METMLHQVPDPGVDINVFNGLASVNQKDINSDTVIPAEPSSCNLIHTHKPPTLQIKPHQHTSGLVK